MSTFSEPNFHMDQGALVIIFIILILVSFLFMLGSSIMNPPEEKVRDLTKKLELTDEKSELRKAWDQRREKEAEQTVVINSPEPAAVDTFFTLGSDKEWVSQIQGPPLGIKGRDWLYGFSSVAFGDGKVVGWKSSELNPLRIGMTLDSIWLFPNPYFRIGSFKEEVIALQGTPDVINGGLWVYGDASVEIQADTVMAWENDDLKHLKAR